MDYISLAKQRFEDDDPLWVRAVAARLHEIDPQLAVQWAIRCAEKLIASRFPKRLADLRADLDAAYHYLEAKADSEDIKDRCYEIWYRPNRDAPQTAVSHLFAALYGLHHENNGVWRAGGAVSLLVVEDWGVKDSNCWSRELFDNVLKQCLDVIDDSEVSNEATNIG